MADRHKRDCHLSDCAIFAVWLPCWCLANSSANKGNSGGRRLGRPSMDNAADTVRSVLLLVDAFGLVYSLPVTVCLSVRRGIWPSGPGGKFHYQVRVRAGTQAAGWGDWSKSSTGARKSARFRETQDLICILCLQCLNAKWALHRMKHAGRLLESFQ